jgi:hypothetical protein
MTSGASFTSQARKRGTRRNKFDKYKHILGDAEEIYAEIEGSWLHRLLIDGVEYWDIDDPDMRPQRHIPNRTCLPSDWRYREDLIYLYRNNMKIADKWKVRLEIQQRLDRKNRNDVAKKRKKGRKFLAI